jgi:hypothetical protein
MAGGAGIEVAAAEAGGLFAADFVVEDEADWALAPIAINKSRIDDSVRILMTDPPRRELKWTARPE